MPSFRKLQVQQLSTDFRAATAIVEEPELPAAAPGVVVVQNHYVGINATDINITNGAYGAAAPPFGCGLEGGASMPPSFSLCVDPGAVD
ncbi:hypothetical protein PINS_up012426 [Pythium insidiosum]|nr:hypothetical protein PINS_up012426 [Pythium insidiosum]